jgi:hypothetical protein
MWHGLVKMNLPIIVLIFLIKKVIGEPWFPGLTLKTLLNWVTSGVQSAG